MGCAQCGKSMKIGGAKKKYAAGGSKMKTTVGSATPKGQIYGIPQTGPTGPNYQGVDTMKKGGVKKAAGGPILDKLKAKLAAAKAKSAERKITKQIKKSVKSSGKIIK